MISFDVPADSSCSRQFQPDSIVDGRYRIVRKLADGGMGTVFLAEHTLIKRRVAIKLLHAELAEDGWMLDRDLDGGARSRRIGDIECERAQAIARREKRQVAQIPRRRDKVITDGEHGLRERAPKTPRAPGDEPGF